MTAADPLPTVTRCVPLFRSNTPVLPAPEPLAITAAALASGLIVTSPLITSLAGELACGIKLIVSKASVPPVSVKARVLSTCSVWMLKLPLLSVTAAENWAEIGPERRALG